MNSTRAGIMMAAIAGLALSQSIPLSSPAFEVVSVKPHELPYGRIAFGFMSVPGPRVLHATGNRFTENIVTVQRLITAAYGVPEDYRILGLPSWAVAREYFDIEAKTEGDETPTSEQLQLMLQTMLADRFQLKLHREMRPLPVYALVIAKNGPKVREITQQAYDSRPRYGSRPARLPELTQSTIFLFTQSLAHHVDRPVVDQTGLAGYYEFATPDWMQPDWDRRTDPMGAQALVFSELENRLGLKLETRKDPVEVLVIDHVERPSPN